MLSANTAKAELNMKNKEEEKSAISSRSRARATRAPLGTRSGRETEIH